jgi:hypothetical protein
MAGLLRLRRSLPAKSVDPPHAKETVRFPVSSSSAAQGWCGKPRLYAASRPLLPLGCAHLRYDGPGASAERETDIVGVPQVGTPWAPSREARTIVEPGLACQPVIPRFIDHVCRTGGYAGFPPPARGSVGLPPEALRGGEGASRRVRSPQLLLSYRSTGTSRGSAAALRTLLASLVGEVRSFSPHEQHDDVTLIVARRRSATSESPAISRPATR